MDENDFLNELLGGFGNKKREEKLTDEQKFGKELLRIASLHPFIKKKK